MVGKRANVLREYHLLIKREPHGFEWQIRYDRHATPVQRSEILHPTHEQATAAGETALAEVRRAAAESLP